MLICVPTTILVRLRSTAWTQTGWTEVCSRFTSENPTVVLTISSTRIWTTVGMAFTLVRKERLNSPPLSTQIGLSLRLNTRVHPQMLKNLDTLENLTHPGSLSQSNIRTQELIKSWTQIEYLSRQLLGTMLRKLGKNQRANIAENSDMRV